MATKTQIIAKQKTVYTENPEITDWDEVEETLHTDTASILENIYKETVVDVSDGTKTVTVSNSNFQYSATFSKVGRHMNLSGFFKNISGATLNTNEPVFTLIEAQETEYEGLVKITGIAKKSGFSSDTITVFFSSLGLTTGNLVANNEQFNFNFIYNLTN